MNWFYHQSLTEKSTTVMFDKDESRHINASKRLRPGDKINIINGVGGLAEAVIEDASNKQVQANVIDYTQFNLPEKKRIIASAIPKAERLTTLFDMATQLGMSEFIPLEFERSINKLSEAKLSRLKRIGISACKQSRRVFVPIIHNSMALDEFLHVFEHHEHSMLLADNKGQSIEQITKNNNVLMDTLVIVVGPEGGLTDQEFNAFNTIKATKLRLCDTILRIETAVISSLALTDQFNHQ